MPRLPFCMPPIGQGSRWWRGSRTISRNLRKSVERRFAGQPPTSTHRDGKNRIEIWDASDFAPWETLRWDRVRVIRYRQHKPDGTVIQAEWLTNFSSRQLGSLSLYH